MTLKPTWFEPIRQVHHKIKNTNQSTAQSKQTNAFISKDYKNVREN